MEHPTFLSCDLCKISKNGFITEYFLVTASVINLQFRTLLPKVTYKPVLLSHAVYFL